MTILHVDTGRGMRGGQHQVRLLMTGLRAEGHEGILLARAGGALGQAMAESGFAVHQANLQETWWWSRRVDLIHAHDARAHSLAAFAARRRFVVSRRVAFPIQRGWFSKTKYQRATRYLAVSRWVAQELLAAGVPAEKVDVVFDGVEVTGSSASWSAADPVVTPGFQNDPGKLTALTQEACRLAGTELVISDDLAQHLTRASVFVYLTRLEGLGSAALLAMAAGVPVVASRVGGLAEVLENDQSGIYVGGGDQVESVELAEDVARGIRRVLDEPGLAARLIAGARARVSEVFPVAKLIQRTIQSYERALAG